MQVRCFVAIELPQEIREALAQLQASLKGGGWGFIKWVDPQGIHLTLKFLGGVDEGLVPRVAQALEGAVRGQGPVVLHLEGLGLFPSPSHPRVAWVGLGGEVPKLKQLQERVEEVLGPLGFPREERPFAAHLTLARLREGAPPAQARAFAQAFLQGQIPALSFRGEGLSLIRSQLTPAGAIYTRLEFFPLG